MIARCYRSGHVLLWVVLALVVLACVAGTATPAWATIDQPAIPGVPAEPPTPEPSAEPSTMPTAEPTRSSSSSGSTMVGDLTDSRGNHVSQYSSPLYDGGITGFEQRASSTGVAIWWAGLRNVLSAWIWLLDFTLDSSWAAVVMFPASVLAQNLTGFFGDINLMGATIAIASVVVGVLLVQSRFGSAMGEATGSAIMIALATTVLASPVMLLGIPGTGGGVVDRAHDAGLELVTDLASSSEDFSGNGMTASMVDTLIRTPHQLIMYGAIIDGTACESVYDETLGTEEARESIGECDSTLQDYADTGGPEALGALFSISPVIVGFALFSAAIVLLSLILAIWAAWSVIKLTWQIVIGIVANGVRQGMYSSLLGLAVSLLGTMFLPLGIVLWMAIVRAMFGPNSPLAVIPVGTRFQAMSALIILGVLVAIILLINSRKQRDRAAAWLASLGATGSSPSQRTPRHFPPISIPLDRLPGMGSNREGPTRPSPNSGPGPQPAVNLPLTMTAVPTPGTPPASRTRLDAGPPRPLLDAGPSSGRPVPPPSGPPHDPAPQTAGTPPHRTQASRELLTRLGVNAAQLVAAGMTGGTSAVASAAARQALTGAAVRALPPAPRPSSTPKGATTRTPPTSTGSAPEPAQGSTRTTSAPSAVPTYSERGTVEIIPPSRPPLSAAEQLHIRLRGTRE